MCRKCAWRNSKHSFSYWKSVIFQGSSAIAIQFKNVSSSGFPIYITRPSAFPRMMENFLILDILWRDFLCSFFDFLNISKIDTSCLNRLRDIWLLILYTLLPILPSCPPNCKKSLENEPLCLKARLALNISEVKYRLGFTINRKLIIFCSWHIPGYLITL